jgi:hypothetical protein
VPSGWPRIAAAPIVAALALMPATQERGAANQPGQGAFHGYRYTRAIERVTYGTHAANVTLEQSTETWVDRYWRGRRRSEHARFVRRSGNPKVARRIVRHGLVTGHRPGNESYGYGDGALAHVPLADLPTDPDALLRLLTDAEHDLRWGPPGAAAEKLFGSQPPDSDATVRFRLARDVVLLLTEANATPELRRALFGVLARLPGVRRRGPMRDARGRIGDGVEIRDPFEPDPSGPGDLRVIVEPRTGDVLSWSLVGKRPVKDPRVHGQLIAESHIFVRTGRVPRLGQRP